MPSCILPAFDALKALLGCLYLLQPIMLACGEGRTAIACRVKIKAARIRKLMREQRCQMLPNTDLSLKLHNKFHLFAGFALYERCVPVTENKL